MPLLFHARVAKDGQPLEKCEDGLAISFRGKVEVYAISDGAGTAAFSGEWASALTNWAVGHPPAEFSGLALSAWLQQSAGPLYQEWAKLIPPYDALPWYGQSGFQEGSQATLLVLCVASGRFHALAVGDTCLFQVRAGQLVCGFPLRCSSDFDTWPALIHTSFGVLPNEEATLRFLEGDYCSGDLFFLATDALSQWLFKQHEAGTPGWDRLLALRQEMDLEQLVGELLANRQMRNDDVALAIVRASEMTGPDVPLQSGQLDSADEARAAREATASASRALDDKLPETPANGAMTSVTAAP